MTAMTAFNAAPPKPCATLAATAIAAPASSTPTKTMSLTVAPQTAPKTKRPATNQYICGFPTGAPQATTPLSSLTAASNATSLIKYRACRHGGIADERSNKPAEKKERNQQTE